jgi:hypothetical protein
MGDRNADWANFERNLVWPLAGQGPTSQTCALALINIGVDCPLKRRGLGLYSKSNLVSGT